MPSQMRRCAIALIVSLIASGCGDDRPPRACELAPAPAALSYGTTSAIYTKDEAIASNDPTVTGTVSTWSVSPALPAGLVFDATAGHITGTPTALQAATQYTVTAANACGAATAKVSITVNDEAPAALTYDTTAAVYTRDAAILVNFPTIAGSVSTWSVTPALPAGLTLDPVTGAISGTPTTEQPPTAYTVTATNSGGSTMFTLLITVNAEAPTALSYDLTAATYTRNVVILPNTPEITGTPTAWSVSPALPAGLALDAVTGAITGTPTALQSAVMYTVTATNSGGSTTTMISITVNDAAPTALSYGTTAAVYTKDVVIEPNDPAVTGSVVTWSVDPALPDGLTLNTTTGQITGMPSTLQLATDYLITATNTGGSTSTTISITVNDAAPTALSYATTSAVYTRNVVIATNDPTVTGSVVSWSISPALPTGLILNTTTGKISGTPTTLQTVTNYTVTATNSGGSTTAAISITVNDAAPTALSYSTTSAVYTRNAAITANTPTVTGSVVSWSISPALPTGLTLNTSTGVITGTPTALQTATTHTITATNTGGSTTATISVTVNDAAPTALTYSTTSAVYTVNAVITANQPTVTGTVVTWSVSPALPAGLTLDTSTGEITGTPTVLQSSTPYVVTATNSGGATTATISITVNDAAPTALSYSTTSAVYTQNAAITPNTPTVTGTVVSWSISPALPTGLTLNTTTGVITGTPTTLQSSTPYIVSATNSGGSTTATISITINLAAPTALSYSAPNATYTINTVITANTPSVTGTVTTWSISPALQTGLTFDTATGEITGTPTALQSSTSYTVTASNSTGSTTATISITVNDDAPSNLSYLHNPVVYTQGAVITANTPSVTGSVVTWSVNPALPNGLTLNTTTGVITGTPTVTQSATDHLITATNSGGSTNVSLKITVNIAPPSALSYATPDAVYTVNTVISTNTPSVTGTVTTWSADQPLPNGLTLNTTTGEITGSPTVTQSQTSYVITAANGSGSTTTTIKITVNEAAPSALSYATPTAVYFVDEVIADNVATVTGSVTTWSIDQTLPTGLFFNTATGKISGTPTGLQSAASYVITASNSGGSTNVTISIEVDNPPPPPSYAVTCTFTTTPATVDCSAPTAATTITGDDNHTLYGGQSVNTVMTTSNEAYDSGTELFSFDATLENLLAQSIGTIDGVTFAPTGIRLILSNVTVDSGTGVISTANATGFSDVPRTHRPYYQYNEKLATNEVSAGKTLQLNVPSSVTAFTASFVISTKVAVKLVINEALVNPGGTITDANGEWFEVYNAGQFPVNMVGFRLGDSAASGDKPTHLITGQPLTIAAGGYLVFGNTTNTTLNGGVPVDYAYGPALQLANSLDAIRIISLDGFVSDDVVVMPTGDVAIQSNPANVEVDRAVYKSAGVSAQNGISRELLNPALDNANMDGSNWGNADVTAVYGPGGRGTPGAQNSVFTP